MKYSAVSLVATTTSLITLGVLVGLVDLPAAWSNVIATAVGTVPSFELNRRWVWTSTGRRSLVGQIMPFCALSFTGLVVSTVAVGMASGRTAGWSHWSHTVAVLSANVAAYGALWVVQYQMLDRVLFRTRTPSPGPLSTPDAPAPDSQATAFEEVSLELCGTSWGDGRTR
jgi:putative flippase GtrA